MARELSAAIQQGGGLVTAADLAAYEVKEREAIHGTYRGYEIIGAPPPSSGGTSLIEILNILEGFNLAKIGNRSAETIHLTAEAFRRAFYDRADFMGDPDFSKVPVPQLIDKKYAEAWRESIEVNHASASRDLKRPQFKDLERVASSTPLRFASPRTRRTIRSSIVRAMRSRSQLRSMIPSARGLPPKGSASCSTTRWMTSPRSRACQTVTG